MNIGKKHAAEYIRSLVIDLKHQSFLAGLHDLMYLLSLAEAEADEIVRAEEQRLLSEEK